MLIQNASSIAGMRQSALDGARQIFKMFKSGCHLPGGYNKYNCLHFSSINIHPHSPHTTMYIRVAFMEIMLGIMYPCPQTISYCISISMEFIPHYHHQPGSQAGRQADRQARHGWMNVRRSTIKLKNVSSFVRSFLYPCYAPQIFFSFRQPY